METGWQKLDNSFDAIVLDEGELVTEINLEFQEIGEKWQLKGK